MTPLTLSLIIIILIGSTAIRSLDIVRFSAFGVDTFANLLYPRFRGSKLPLFRVGKIVYPPFLPSLLYLLQGRMSDRFLHLLPKFFDIFSALAVFFFTVWFTKSESQAIVALFVFSLSPINIISSRGISTRNIGLFFFTLSVLSFYIGLSGMQYSLAMYAISTVSAILMMLSSRIAYKTYLILAALMLLIVPFYPNFIIFTAIALLTIGLTLLLTKGKFINDISGQFFLIRFFRARHRMDLGLKKIVKIFLYEPSLILALVAMVINADPFFTFTIISVLTLSIIWIWGEGERHIMLATGVSSILASSILVDQMLILIPLLLLNSILIVRHTSAMFKGRLLVSITPSMLHFMEKMKQSIPPTGLIVCLPREYNFPVAYYTDRTVLYGESTSREGVFFQAEIDDALKAGVGLEGIYSKYQFTHIFIDERFISEKIDLNIWSNVIQQPPLALYIRNEVRAR